MLPSPLLDATIAANIIREKINEMMLEPTLNVTLGLR